MNIVIVCRTVLLPIFVIYNLQVPIFYYSWKYYQFIILRYIYYIIYIYQLYHYGCTLLYRKDTLFSGLRNKFKLYSKIISSYLLTFILVIPLTCLLYSSISTFYFLIQCIYKYILYTLVPIKYIYTWHWSLSRSL